MRGTSITPKNFARSLAVIAAAYAGLGGLLSFLGWVSGVYRLTDWSGGGISMKANAALATTVTAIALLLIMLSPSQRLTARVLGAFVAVIGALTLLEHITSVSLGIDTWLFHEPAGAAATAAPGRMGPPAAASFLALGLAIGFSTGALRARRVSVVLALAVLAIATLSLSGYLYGAQAMYTVPRLTGIALQTVSLLLALSIALIAYHADLQPMRTLCEDSNAGVLARRLVPLAIVVPLGLGWLRLQGQDAGLYDLAFGTALRSLVEVGLLVSILWACLQAIRARDLSHHRALSRERESERRLAETLESINDGFVAFDAAWRFTFVNAEAEHLLGRPRGELLGNEVWELFPQAVGSELHAQLHRAARERVSLEVEASSPRGDDRRFMNRIYPSPDGGLSVYFHDITDRVRAEEVLREADRRKDEFLATLAHELRNPLAPIRNAARVLLTQDLPQSRQQWAAEMIGRQVKHMARLLDDLMDVSRIARNRLELRLEWIELAPVVQSALEASRPAIDQAGHDLRVTLPAEPVYLDADAVRLTQVVSNLLNNAGKYTEDRGIIELIVELAPRDVLIRVRDNGIGISPEIRPQLFEMFAQASSHISRAQGGLGIGLALARGIVELHGGSIEVESAGERMGSEFTVRLPRLVGVEDAAEVPAQSELKSSQSLRVLVVDDLPDNADSLAALLETMGHRVDVVYGGADAFDKAAAVHPDVVFLDLGMPEIDGFEVCRRLRATPWGRALCLIALTGWGQAEDRRRTQEHGFDHHLVKPIDPLMLRDLVAQLPRATASL
jgi:PAS domain S-box-containing protein